MGRFESDARFLEGTGSLVLDHDNKIAYVCHSSRSHPDVMDAFVSHTGYRPVWFHAVDRRGKPIYHTNVMMCIGRTLAVVCMESIADRAERGMLAQSVRDRKRIDRYQLRSDDIIFGKHDRAAFKERPSCVRDVKRCMASADRHAAQPHFRLR